jgi:uncharacterized protein YjbI with pentapeptide repeats
MQSQTDRRFESGASREGEEVRTRNSLLRDTVSRVPKSENFLPARKKRLSTLANWAEIIGLPLAIAAILFAVVEMRDNRKIFEASAEYQEKTMHYQAWETITNAYGQSGDGGRKLALEELHNAGKSLATVNVAGAILDSLRLHPRGDKGIFLSDTEMNSVRADLSRAMMDSTSLCGADLSWANLRESDLSGADLRGADLSWTYLHSAKLTAATLSGADLRGADLWEADLCGADLVGAGLSGAKLLRTKLTGANLNVANLSWSRLRYTDLRGACLFAATLSGADLRRVDLGGADLSFATLDSVRNWRAIKSLTGANLYGIKMTPDSAAFVSWAVDTMGAVLMDPGKWIFHNRSHTEPEAKEKRPE